MAKRLMERFQIPRNQLIGAVPVAFAILFYIIVPAFSAERYSQTNPLLVLPIALICAWYWLQFPRTGFANAVAFFLLSAVTLPALTTDLERAGQDATIKWLTIISAASVATIISRLATGIRATLKPDQEPAVLRETKYRWSILDIAGAATFAGVFAYFAVAKSFEDGWRSAFIAAASALSTVVMWRAIQIGNALTRYTGASAVALVYFCAIYYLTPISRGWLSSFSYERSYGVSAPVTLVCVIAVVGFAYAANRCGMKVITNEPRVRSAMSVIKPVQYALFCLYLGLLVANLLMPHSQRETVASFESHCTEVGWPKVFRVTEYINERMGVFRGQSAVDRKSFLASAFVFDVAIVGVLAASFGFGLSLLSSLKRDNGKQLLTIGNGMRIASLLSCTVGLAASAHYTAKSYDLASMDLPFYTGTSAVSAPLIERFIHGANVDRITSVSTSATDLVAANSFLKSVNTIDIDRVDSKVIELLRTYPQLRSLTISSEPIGSEVFAELMHQLHLIRIRTNVARDAELICNSEYLHELIVSSRNDQGRITVKGGKKLEILEAYFYGNGKGSFGIDNCRRLESITVETLCNETELKVQNCPKLTMARLKGDRDSSAIQIFDASIVSSPVETLSCSELSPRLISNQANQPLVLGISYERPTTENIFSGFHCDHISRVVYNGDKNGALLLLKKTVNFSSIESVYLGMSDLKSETIWNGFEQFTPSYVVDVASSPLDVDEAQLTQLRESAPPNFELLDPNIFGTTQGYHTILGTVAVPEGTPLDDLINQAKKANRDRP